MRKITKYNLKVLEKFLEDKRNWRPPSLSTIAKFMGYKSKASAKIALIKLRLLSGDRLTVNEIRLLKKLPALKN